jgi:transposase
MTSISPYGAYEHTEDEFAAPRFGHPKDRRPDLKQVQAGLAVTGDGGVPVFHRAYDGGSGEIAQVVGADDRAAKDRGAAGVSAGRDSKLVSYNNLSAMIAAGVGFVAPASKTYVPTVLADPDLQQQGIYTSADWSRCRASMDTSACRPGTPRLDQLLGGVSEQHRRQPQRPHRCELVDLAQQRLR